MMMKQQQPMRLPMRGQPAKKSGPAVLKSSSAFAASLAAQDAAKEDPSLDVALVDVEATVEATAEGLSVNAKRVPEVLIGLMEELIVIFKSELAYVKKRDFQSLQEQAPQRNRLQALYEANYKALAEHPELIRDAAAPLRAKFAETGKRFAAITEENATALKGALTAMHRVDELVLKMMRDKARSKQLTYADPRKTGGASKAGGRTALDRTA